MNLDVATESVEESCDDASMEDIQEQKEDSSGKSFLKPEFHLHVNFWSFEDIDNTEGIENPRLDIGLQIKNYHLLDNVTLHCPFSIKEKDVIDLSSKLESKSNACIIFNAECEIETKDSYTIIDLTEKKDKLLVFPLEQVIEDVYKVETSDKKKGTRLVFQFGRFHEYVKQIEKLREIETIYIRFRITALSLKEHIYFDSEPLNKSFESAFSGTRIIDFKVNEKRNLPENIKAEVLINHDWARFNSIHFLVMVPSSYDLTSFYKESMTCRELEEDLWDDYLDTEILFANGHVLAYHWRAKETLDNASQEMKKVEDFSCLVKVNYSRAQKRTIAAYACSVIGLGIASSMIVTLISDFFAPGVSFFMVCMVATGVSFLLTNYFGKQKRQR